MIRLRAEAASTSHSLPLPPPFILSPTISDAPSSWIPPPLPISVPISSPPFLLPSASRREDRLEVTLPPRKRLGIALGPRYEVGESSSSAAARPARGLRADYSFVATMDREIRARLSREAWRRLMDASDLTRGEVMSLRTTVLGQMSENRELHAADRRRLVMQSLQGQVTTLLGQVTSLQGQVTTLQGQQGLAGGPTQPELPEEAGSSS
ncbi:hypothetical protein Tco_0671919 [Tanacetum coccineum]